MILPDLNVVAIVVAGVIYFVIGALWYSLLFTRPFIRYRGMTEAELQQSGNPMEYVLTLLNDLIAAFALAVIVGWVGATNVGDGIVVGLLVAAGLVATSSLTYTIYSGPHKMLWAIYTGYQVVAFAVMGVILTMWK